MNRLNIHYFAHSWVSDWNHGNAHFLRGLAGCLVGMGHNVRCYEQLGSWSLTNLASREGERAVAAIDEFRARFPELNVRFYNNDQSFEAFASDHLRGADVVVIHEWNDPAVVNTILSLKEKLGFVALFQDTHHRAYTNPREILRFRLDLFDGVLAFGETIRKIYVDGFGMRRAWTFHEAADTRNFKPLPCAKDCDVVWIGNWGDEERTTELQEFLIEPAAKLPDRKFVVHGVRYPGDALDKLSHAGVEFRGYLPNLSTPRAYAQAQVALHVPRRHYANGLSGIPTIRVFEVLACGTPMVCSPWEDVEGLFRPGQDYVCARDAGAMIGELQHLLKDEAARQHLAQNGLETIRRQHTCGHRARQFIDICEELAK